MKAAAGRKSKLLELDIVRALAILAVVLIHATSGPRETLQEGSISQAFFFVANVAGAFAVPLFILLSGVVLFYSYDGRWSGRTALQFFKKRAIGLLIPYLVWAFFYYGYNQYISTNGLIVDWAVLWRMLRWAEWSYHSYFMLIIMQMYVLFPLFMTLVHKLPQFRKWLIPLGIAVQGGFYVYKHWFATLSYTDRAAPTYIAYFLIGGAIGLYYGRVKAWMESRWGWVAAGWLVCGTAYVGLLVLNQYMSITPNHVWFELAWFCYVIASALFFMQAGRWLLGGPQRLYGALASMGACSFGIYLLHPAILTAYSIKVQAPSTILLYDLYVLACYVTIFGGSWLVVYVYKKVAEQIKLHWTTKGRRRPKDSPAPFSSV